MSLDLARITKAHVNIRDARHELKKQYEAEDEKLKVSQQKTRVGDAGSSQQAWYDKRSN